MSNQGDGEGAGCAVVIILAVLGGLAYWHISAEGWPWMTYLRCTEEGGARWFDIEYSSIRAGTGQGEIDIPALNLAFDATFTEEAVQSGVDIAPSIRIDRRTGKYYFNFVSQSIVSFGTCAPRASRKF